MWGCNASSSVWPLDLATEISCALVVSAGSHGGSSMLKACVALSKIDPPDSEVRRMLQLFCVSPLLIVTVEPFRVSLIMMPVGDKAFGLWTLDFGG